MIIIRLIFFVAMYLINKSKRTFLLKKKFYKTIY